jgi:hypothetical protein
MKKGTKVLALFALGLVLSSLLIGFVSSDTSTPAGVINSISDPLKSVFSDWSTAGNISINVTKFLFLILLTLLIWSILDTVGIITNGGIRFLISLIVSFLGTMYLTPSDVWMMLTSYSALGSTILTFFPLFILVLFTFRMVIKGGAMGIVYQWATWAIYFLFLIGDIVIGMVNGNIKMNDPTAWIYVVAFIIAAVALFFNMPLVNLISTKYLNAETQTAHNMFERATRNIRENATQHEQVGRGTIDHETDSS